MARMETELVRMDESVKRSNGNKREESLDGRQQIATMEIAGKSVELG